MQRANDDELNRRCMTYSILEHKKYGMRVDVDLFVFKMKYDLFLLKVMYRCINVKHVTVFIIIYITTDCLIRALLAVSETLKIID